MQLWSLLLGSFAFVYISSNGIDGVELAMEPLTKL